MTNETVCDLSFKMETTAPQSTQGTPNTHPLQRSDSSPSLSASIPPPKSRLRDLIITNYEPARDVVSVTPLQTPLGAQSFGDSASLAATHTDESILATSSPSSPSSPPSPSSPGNQSQNQSPKITSTAAPSQMFRNHRFSAALHQPGHHHSEIGHSGPRQSTQLRPNPSVDTGGYSPTQFLSRLKRNVSFFQDSAEASSPGSHGGDVQLRRLRSPGSSTGQARRITEKDLRRLSTRLVKVSMEDGNDPASRVQRGFVGQDEMLLPDEIPPWIQMSEQTEGKSTFTIPIMFCILTVISLLVIGSIVSMWLFTMDNAKTSISQLNKQLRDASFYAIEVELGKVITYPVVVSSPLKRLITDEIDLYPIATDEFISKVNYLMYINYGTVSTLPSISLYIDEIAEIIGYYSYDFGFCYVRIANLQQLAYLYAVDPSTGQPGYLLQVLPLTVLGASGMTSADTFIDWENPKPLYRIENMQSAANQYLRFFAFHFPFVIEAPLKKKYTLTLSYEMEAFQEFLGTLEYSDNAEFFVLSNDGHILATNEMKKDVNGSVIYYFNSPNLTLITESPNSRFRRCGSEILKKFKSFSLVDSLYEKEFNLGSNKYTMSVSFFADYEDISNLYFVYGVVSPNSDFDRVFTDTNEQYTIIFSAILGITLIFGMVISYIIITPLRKLENEMKKLQLLNFSESSAQQSTDLSRLVKSPEEPEVTELEEQNIDYDFNQQTPKSQLSGENDLSIVKEIRVIQSSFLALRRGLQSFSRYVPQEIVSHILSYDGDARLGVRHVVMTMLFSDIENYTTMAESMNLTGLIEFLGQYFSILTEAISSRGGMVAEFLGDGVLAFWNAPLTIEDHAAMSIDAAIASQAALDKLQIKWQKKKLLNCHIKTRIGINTGEVLVGNIGSPNRMKFGIVGDNLNLASLIEGLNKLFGTQLIVSEETRNMAISYFVFRPLLKFRVKGKRAPTTIYEVLSRASDASEMSRTKSRLFTQAFECYYKKDFAQCIETLSNPIFASDRPASILTERAKPFLMSSPPADWDGIEELETK